jgi:hypothetical protein
MKQELHLRNYKEIIDNLYLRELLLAPHALRWSEFCGNHFYKAFFGSNAERVEPVNQSDLGK